MAENAETESFPPLGPGEFETLLAMQPFSAFPAGEKPVAVGLSGGPDSMALTWLLSGWAARRGIAVHALTVDHGLRPESGEEAKQAGAWIKNWPGIHHEILKWQSTPVKTGVQEQARFARYGLMGAYCRKQDIPALFLAHHRDDQAETVLFRLASGSGLDGLCAMSPVQDYEGIKFLRPFLDIPKVRLLSLCDTENLPYLQDPSNNSARYARARLRQARAVLEREGLTSKRLAQTARRLGRARKALDTLSHNLYQDSIKKIDTKQIVFNYEDLKKQPEELVFRVILKAVGEFRPETDYPPRMEKTEVLLADLMAPEPFRKRTLGGVIFERNDQEGLLILIREKTA